MSPMVRPTRSACAGDSTRACLGPTAVEQSAAIEVRLYPCSPLSVSVQPLAVPVRAGDEFGKGRHRVEGGRLVHPQLLFDRPARDLHRHVGTGVPSGFVVGQVLQVGPPRSGFGRVGQDGGSIDGAPKVESIDPVVVLARSHVDRALADLGRDPDQGLGLLVGRRHRGNRTAPVPQVEAGSIGREAQGPSPYGLGHDRSHGGDLVIGGRSLVGGVAHDVEPDRGMTDVTAEVDQRAPAADRLEVLGIGLEVPDHAGFEGGHAHVFDLVEGSKQRGPVLGPGGCDAVAAVPGDDAGHPVPTGGGQRRVPEDLGVVVGVDVEKARGYQPPRRIDLRIGRHLTGDLHHHAARDAYVCPHGRTAGPIDDHAPSNSQLRHGSAPGAWSRRDSWEG